MWKKLETKDLKNYIKTHFDNINTASGRVVDATIILLILVSSGIFIALTHQIPDSLRFTLKIIDAAIIIIFTLEYLLRYWLADGKIKYVFSIFSIIDLLVILPFYLGFLTDLGFLVILRVFRILRLIRFVKGRRLIPKTENEDAYVLINIIFTVFSIIFIFSGLFYFTEHNSNPELVSSFFDAVYFSVSTMSTVGFGDITPITMQGRIVTITMIISGIILIPWQISVFLKRVIRTASMIHATCKNCGLQHHDKDATFCKDCGQALFNPNK
jgi:voltage-gated potassium channel